ncbi:HNH endonuclease [Bacillus altitudinis]|uniref:HNH endonuclease n=1 Tax=Bacillus altitudinis TaxID=293387 RepID=UPI001F6126E0|nr:HNH endonuclease [Bacillus altitudinis]WRO25165.1 HNH endonuclease [Bacillus altitudinis]
MSIIERDGGYCQRCMIKYNIITTDKLQVHHIMSHEHYPELKWNESNLATLCRTCNAQLGTKDKLDFNFEIGKEDERIPVL